MRKDSDLSRVKGLSPSASGPPVSPKNSAYGSPSADGQMRVQALANPPKLSTKFHKFKYDGVSTST